MNEEEFLKSTPKKIGALWNVHCEFNGFKISQGKIDRETKYIDEIPFL